MDKATIAEKSVAIGRKMIKEKYMRPGAYSIITALLSQALVAGTVKESRDEEGLLAHDNLHTEERGRPYSIKQYLNVASGATGISLISTSTTFVEPITPMHIEKALSE